MSNKIFENLEPNSKQIEVNIIGSIEDLKSVKENWDNLLHENNNDNLFLEFDWIENWWNFFGERHDMFIFSILENGHLIGLFPLMITKKMFYKVINFIGYPEASYMDFILTDQSRERCIQIVANYLRELKGNYILILFGFAEDSPNYKILNKYLNNNKANFFIREFECPYIKIDQTFIEYYKEKCKHHSIKIMKRNEKRFVEVGKLTYKKLDSSRINEIFELHEKRWKKKNDTSHFSEKTHRKFFSEIATKENLSFDASANALLLGEKIIAFCFVFLCNGKFLAYSIAHNEDFSVFDPGRILVKEIIHECFESDMKIFNFGLGDARYKHEWAVDKERINEIVFSTNSPFSRILYTQCLLRKKLIDILKKCKSYNNIKVNILGKIKYFTSGGYFKDLYKSIFTDDSRDLKKKFTNLLKRAFELIYSVKEYTIYEKVLCGSHQDKHAIPTVKSIGEIINCKLDHKSCDYERYEAKLKDLDFLCKITDEEPSKVVKRFYKKQKCFVVTHENKIVQCTWVDIREMEIPDIKFKEPMEEKKAFINQCITDKSHKNIDIDIQTINYINSVLYKNKFNKSCFCVDRENAILKDRLMEQGFNPIAKIKFKNVLFKSAIKYC